jgi:plasmid maintenance system antidote protein VapI
MKNKKNINLTDQELVEAFVFPSDLSPDEQKSADAEMKDLRMQRLREMTESQRLLSDLLRLKFEMEDYLQNDEYSEANSFGAFLRRYLKILDRKQRDFAEAISLHPTKFNQLLSGKSAVNAAIAYRLEKHSGGLIPASLWWNLHAKKVEANIRGDQKERLKEGERVKGALAFSS